MAVIGITDTLRPSHEYYPRWVRAFAPDTEVIRLSPVEHNADALSRCDGLLLSGGGDIHPGRYGCSVDPLSDGINEERDAFEYEVIAQALKDEMPILGICRGMQIFSVFLGGSMIPDVQRAGYADHGKGKGSEDRVHTVLIEPQTMLQTLVPSGRGSVNTNHHQAVDRVGEGLAVTARAEDGIIEALEWKHRQSTFLLLVQWHPERMQDAHNPLCNGVLAEFMDAVSMSTGKDKDNLFARGNA